jgi:fatty-acid desaturase
MAIILLYGYYILAWILLLGYWVIDPTVWAYGLIGGWFFHMIICSVILHKYFTHKTYKVNRVIHWIITYL